MFFLAVGVHLNFGQGEWLPSTQMPFSLEKQNTILLPTPWMDLFSA